MFAADLAAKPCLLRIIFLRGPEQSCIGLTKSETRAIARSVWQKRPCWSRKSEQTLTGLTIEAIQRKQKIATKVDQETSSASKILVLPSSRSIDRRVRIVGEDNQLGRDDLASNTLGCTKSADHKTG